MNMNDAAEMYVITHSRLKQESKTSKEIKDQRDKAKECIINYMIDNNTQCIPFKDKYLVYVPAMKKPCMNKVFIHACISEYLKQPGITDLGTDEFAAGCTSHIFDRVKNMSSTRHGLKLKNTMPKNEYIRRKLSQHAKMHNRSLNNVEHM